MKSEEKMIEEILQVIAKYRPFALNDIKEAYKRCGSLDHLLVIVKALHEAGASGFIKKLQEIIK